MSRAPLATSPDDSLRARADAAHDERRTAEAIELDLALLDRLAEHDDPRQIDVLTALLARSPPHETPDMRLRLALLHADHGDAAVAARLLERALAELPQDRTRLHALRRLAGLHRRGGDTISERGCLQEALDLARLLNESRARRELEAALRFVDARG